MRTPIAFVGLVLVASVARAQPAAPPPDCGTADQCLTIAVDALQKKDFATAMPPLRRACELGAAWGCAGLGQRYERGEGVTADPATAVTYYAKACDLGANNACYNLAAMYWSGTSGKTDAARARTLFQRACDLGQPKGCEEVKAIDAAAPPDYPAQCAKGDLAACAEQASDLIEKDNKKAFAIAKKACDGGVMRGCSVQGIASSYLGTRGWEARAVKLFQRACDGGDTVGCRELGSMYVEGAGVKRDFDRAARLFEQSCAGDDPDAMGCDKAAEAAYNDESFDRMLGFAQRACALDDAEGCDWVGVASQHLEDWSGAAKWYDTACTMGAAHGCSMMSSWYGPSGGNPTIQPDADKAKAYEAKLRAAQAKAQ